MENPGDADPKPVDESIKNTPAPEPKDKDDDEPLLNDKKTITNYTENLLRIVEMKDSANRKFSTDLDGAIALYQSILTEIEELMVHAKEEREINPQVKEIENQKKLVMSNLALGYYKTNKLQASAEIDEKIIMMDPNFDKSYARVAKTYLELGRMENAIYYGQMLKNKFTEDTQRKYVDVIKIIDAEFEKMSKKWEEQRVRERNSNLKKYFMYGTGILLVAYLIWHFWFKRRPEEPEI